VNDPGGKRVGHTKLGRRKNRKLTFQIPGFSLFLSYLKKIIIKLKVCITLL
jgi:hypothetical protein